MKASRPTGGTTGPEDGGGGRGPCCSYTKGSTFLLLTDHSGPEGGRGHVEEEEEEEGSGLAPPPPTPLPPPPPAPVAPPPPPPLHSGSQAHILRVFFLRNKKKIDICIEMFYSELLSIECSQAGKKNGRRERERERGNRGKSADRELGHGGRGLLWPRPLTPSRQPMNVKSSKRRGRRC